MKSFRPLWCVVAVLALALPAGALADQWLHVYVQENGEAGETVRVNVPLSLAKTVLPVVEKQISKEMKLKEQPFTIQDLRNIWSELKTVQNTNFVTVDSPEANVRISIRRNHVVVEADEASKTQVNIRIPNEVVDALLSGDAETLNLQAALEALSGATAEDLVSIQEEDSTVRIWIDQKAESKRGERLVGR
jgi:hypothetical protein